jgi:hypothetical protein
VVVDGDGEGPLGALLADDILVQDLVDLDRLGKVLELEGGRGGELLIDDLVAEVDALVADVDARAGDQLLDLALGLAAEAAEKLLVGFGRTCQRNSLPRVGFAGRREPPPKLRGGRAPARSPNGYAARAHIPSNRSGAGRN